MTNKREQRKNEHVRLALAQSDTLQSDFDRIQFVHHAIPEMDVDEVTLLPNFKALHMSHVLYINAMTGGSEWTVKTNEQLAQVAKATQIPMAVGSMHAALKNPAVRHSYAVAREQYPEGQIWANVSADVTLEEAQAAIEMIHANALQIHVNAPQELVMPEGNRQFKHWLTRISEIIKGVEVPVIVKEVGFGMRAMTRYNNLSM